jgi:aryl-alcohol dehydrogenase-like predicted oxidoreductase
VQYTFLGATGLRVSELCLGAMTFGDDWGWGADEATSRAMFDAFSDAGGTFVDTANVYTGGTSERLLGRFLAGRRDRFVVATKYAISTDHSDPNAEGGGRKNLRRQLEGSLRRLDTDHIDLYWVHLWDGFTPVEETIRALDDAVRAGQVLHVGFSDYPAWLVARADALAELAHLTRPAAIQVEYNLAARDVERELLPMAESLGMSVLDWSPLGGGALTGKHLDGGGGHEDTGAVRRSEAVRHFAKYDGQRARTIAAEVVAVAGELGCSPSQLAIAWLRHRSPAHIPVVGARTTAHLADNLRAVDVRIPEAALARLDEVSAIDLGFPSEFYRQGRAGWFGPHLDHLAPGVRPRGPATMGLPT